MKVLNEEILLKTGGDPDLVDITAKVAQVLKGSGLKKGIVTVFVVGSTAAITTFEYEPGLISDMRDVYDAIAPKKKDYHHDRTWGDANGFSHARAALQGPSLTVPFERGKMVLGTWQQIVLAEFDNRPRERRVVVQVMGE